MDISKIRYVSGEFFRHHHFMITDNNFYLTDSLLSMLVGNNISLPDNFSDSVSVDLGIDNIIKQNNTVIKLNLYAISNKFPDPIYFKYRWKICSSGSLLMNNNILYYVSDVIINTNSKIEIIKQMVELYSISILARQDKLTNLLSDE